MKHRVELGSRPIPHSGKIVLFLVLILIAVAVIISGCGRLPTDPVETETTMGKPKPARTITWVPIIRVTPTPDFKPPRTVTWAPPIRVTP
jgi:hypothetical protein